jgi:diguanylate cyclase (GGDEF)-like protein
VAQFRLLDLRHDRTLAIGLIAGAAVVFQRPLRFLLDAAGEAERVYNLDLMPALVVLCVIFMFQQYNKRQESRAAAMAAETAMRAERARSDELDELVAFGRSLANALQFKEIEQALLRNLPTTLRDCRLSIVTPQPDGWRMLVHDDDSAVESPTAFEEAAAAAVGLFGAYTGGTAAPVAINGLLCLPVFANRELVGAAVLVDEPASRDPRVQASLGPVLMFVGIAVRNVQLMSKSREESVRDGLTRWFNRRHGMELLQNELRRAARSGRHPSVLMFDLDGFKAVNDHQGHLQGDAVLQTVTRVVAGLVRASDIKCRYGGDEFLVILPETTEAGALRVAEQVRHAVRAADLAVSPNGPRVTASIGVTSALPGEMDPEQPIARADAALYKAKRAGRDQVALHESTEEREVPPLQLVASKN